MIDFIGYRRIAFVISGILILIGIFQVWKRKGGNFGIDFRGGTLVQLGFKKEIKVEKIREILEKNGFKDTNIQEVIGSNSFIFRFPVVEKSENLGFKIEKVFKDIDPEVYIERIEMVGPVVGRYLIKLALKAFIFAFFGIIIYIGIRFKGTIWGVSAVIALLHDVFITFGLLNLVGCEISLVVVSGLLLLAGYSVNDTIVVYDRIRENLRLKGGKNLKETFNLSIRQTLSRTLITSITTLLVVLALFFFGGEVIHDFSITLLFGIIIGTYSSIFIASPIVWGFLEKGGR
ncbi:MAG: protein translocase subunit SecF [Caldiserica bacterium]|nr:MAG: protein translocase subunit SecF [Caldisericota bacterium]